MANPTTIYEFLDPPVGEDEIGRLGPYRITGLLGQGGMGYVFKAHDIRLKRPVALKVMKAKIAAIPNSRKRFLAEARSMAAVHHDNVATIFEVGQRGDTPFMAMALLKGSPLDNTNAANHQFAVDEIIRIAIEICRGLSAAHDEGIIHRDIKPANIWLEESSGRVKILDFGLAIIGAQSDRFSRSGNVTGTPGYLAPEQARNEPVDDRTDLYGLGAVLYELCAGHPPLASENIAELLIRILAHTPLRVREANPDIPEPLANLIDQLLSKEPKDRPKSAAHLEKQLEKTAKLCASNRRPTINIVTAEDSAIGIAKDDLDQTENNTTWKSPLVAAIATLAVVLFGIAWWSLSDDQQKKTKLRTTSSEIAQSQQAKPITAASLQPLELSSANAVSPIIMTGQAARFKMKLINNAVGNEDNPAKINRSARFVAQIVTYITRQDQPRHRAPNFPTKLSAAQLPGLGQAKDVEISFLTASLPTETFTLEFELQAPDGSQISSTTSSFELEENLASGELIGFQYLRTSDGQGKDGFVRKGNDANFSNTTNLQVARRKGLNDEHTYLQFDFSVSPVSRKDIDRAVLTLTLAPRGSQGSTSIIAYGLSRPFSWNEKGGEQRLRWKNSPSSRDIKSLTYLGQTIINNSKGELEQVADAGRIFGSNLDHFLQSTSDNVATIVLVCKSWGNQPARFHCRESKPQFAPALALRSVR